MDVLGFNRVELIVASDQIDAAVKQFNDVLGTNLVTPHAIAGQAVVSSTDFDGGIELVAPLDESHPMGKRLATKGPGQIGPLVWEIADVDAARAWLIEHGYTIMFEYDSSKGTEDEAKTGVYQLCLDPSEWFGYIVTLMHRSPTT